MIRAVSDGCSTFGLELCVCSRGCGSLLTRYDFGTDQLGRTLEKCPKCGPRLLQPKHGAPTTIDARHYKAKVIGKCADCPTVLTWRGTGTHPTRCPPCRKKHERAQDLASYHRRSA